MKTTPVGQAGYTIIETMIFLIISSTLVLGAVGLFNGRIQRTQFTQSAQAFDTLLKSTANEAATGTYPEKTLICTITSGEPVEGNSSTATQGTRSGCVFVGKIVAPDDTCVSGTTSIQDMSCQSVDIYSVVGLRLTTAGQVTGSLTGTNEAKPRIFSKLTQTVKLGYGTRLGGIYQETTPDPTLNSGVGFFQSFNGSYDASSNLNSGSQNIQTWYLRNAATTPVSPTSLADMKTILSSKSVLAQSSNDTYICLISGNGDQRAKISFIGTNGGLTTNLTILSSVSDPVRNAACL